MKKIFKYYIPYIPAILLIFALLFGRAMSELALPGYMSDIINSGIIKSDMDYIKATGIAMIGVAFAGVIFSMLSSLVASRVAAKTSLNIRHDLFYRVTDFSSNEMNKFGSSSLITRTTNDIQSVQQAAVLIMRIAFYAPIIGIGAVIKAVNTSTKLTYTIGISLTAIFLLMVVVFIMVAPKFKQIQTKLDKLNLIVGERLSGLLVVRAFNNEEFEEKRFDTTNKELRKINIFVNRTMSFLFPALMLIMNLTSILIVYAGAKNIDANNLMIGDMLAFLQYAMQVIMAFLFITMIFVMVPRAAVSAKRISEVLNTKSSIVDKEETKKLPNNMQGVIEFKNVCFGYDKAEELVLSNINFKAKPGKFTAIIGSTGSGKSTLINLIPRFYEATNGSIYIDGVNIKDISQEDLRKSIGYIPQKSLLFSGTVRTNLEFGLEDASEDEINEALSVSQSLDFVSSMANGLDTEVSQGGTSVSGGQKQRLSIARALIKKPKIYLFDDSFSALDYKTDRKLRTALKETESDKTFIIVAQRINTIVDADNILVLDDGKIVGEGTHEELLRNNKVYQEIAYSQLSEKELSKYLGKEALNV